MKTRMITCSALAIGLAVAAPLAAQDTAKTVELKAQLNAEEEASRRDAERQMRDAERKLRDAERAMQEAARKMAEFHSQKTLEMMKKRVVVFGDNARLGLVLRPDRDPKTDAAGAVVQALTPGGPAEEAGLQPGDIIVKFNGEALAGPEGVAGGVQGGVKGGVKGGVVSAVPVSEEGPTDRLTERAATLKEGDTVTLEVKRGDKTSTYTVTARKLFGPKVRVFSVGEGGHGYDFDVNYETPEPPEPPEPPEAPEAPDAPEVWAASGNAWYAFASGFRGIDMVTLNPDLAEYFGAKEGILVVRVKDGSPYKLKAGDVILKIGDRVPSSPEQALRILRSYSAGETVPIEVMRKHERTTLSVELPQRHSGYTFKMTVPAPESALPATPSPHTGV